MNTEELKEAVKVMKEELRLCFCRYKYRTDEWTHLPTVIERIIDKFIQKLEVKDGT